ncbi:MAG: tetratricopeptide repeat protein, partial [Hyphomicrobiaceae bacterium]
MRRIIAGVVLVLGLAGEAAAQSNWKSCTGDDHNAAIAACTQLIDDGNLDRKDLAIAYHNRGLSRAAKGDSDTAIVDLTKAIEIDPRYANAYYARGAVYARMSAHDRSIADDTKAIEIHPNFALAYNDRGLGYARKGEHDRAIADFTKTVEIDPDYADAYHSRGRAREKKGEPEPAIADYSKAIEVNPKFALAYHDRGVLYAKKSEHDRAIADFGKALEVDPQYADAYRGRASSYLSKGDYGKAAVDFTAVGALKLGLPGEIPNVHDRDWNACLSDDHDAAVAACTRLIGSGILELKKIPMAYYNRALSLIDKGEHDRAIADHTKAIEVNPKFAEAYTYRGIAHHRKG